MNANGTPNVVNWFNPIAIIMSKCRLLQEHAIGTPKINGRKDQGYEYN